MRRMRRLGLRGKMTVSYLLVTAAAVLLVEILVALFVTPGLLASPSTDAPSVTVERTAMEYAALVIDANARLGRLPTAAEIQLGDPGVDAKPGQARVKGGAVIIPRITGTFNDNRPVPLALLLDPDLRIVASSYPGRYPVGGQVGGPEVGPLPVELITPGVNAKSTGGQARVGGAEILTALAPVPRVGKPGLLSGDRAVKPVPADALGYVYVQTPATAEVKAAEPRFTQSAWNDLMGQLGGGLLVLLGALPVGVVFGLLSTRPLIRRVRRLAASTVAVADGQYQHRVPVSGSDEVAQLEGNFNRMAARLSDAITAERQLASAGERARIARELHDSISQDLFSLRLLAGALRRALPTESPLYPQVEAMERTATGTMHEMQALLLELRPIALQDAGLRAAVDELCQAYSDRLGVAVIAELEPVPLEPAVEHAVLRIIQEALANAVKHARPNRITVVLKADEETVTVSITDDGNGFDPERAAERHGMGLALMRERAAELGGEFAIESAPGRGTTVHIRLPRGRP